MSRIREIRHHQIEVLQRELRREDEEVREEAAATRAPETETVGPEIDDVPLGVPPDDERGDGVELPGFPRGDPTHG